MQTTYTGVDDKAQRALEKQLKKLLESGLSDRQINLKAKQLVKEFNENKKNFTKKALNENNKWIRYLDNSEFEIIFPDGTSSHDIPILGETLLEKNRISTDLQFDKIAGRFYEDLKWIFDDYKNDKDYNLEQAGTDIELAMGKNNNLSRTIVNTMFDTADRIKNIAEGEIAGYNYFHFIHTAPERPFCQLFDDVILHKDDWMKLDKMPLGQMFNLGYSKQGNGQGMPILSGGGGFNCRGDMRPVSEKQYESHIKNKPERYDVFRKIEGFEKLFATKEKEKPKDTKKDTVDTSEDVQALKERAKVADNKYKRRDIIKTFMKLARNNNKLGVYNKDLDANILITRDSIDETASNAAPFEDDTNLVFELIDVLVNAKVVKTDLPIKIDVGMQQKFSSMIELSHSITGIGSVKLMIGVRKTDNEKIQYSLTKIR